MNTWPNSPTPADIRAARKQAGLTQAAAAALVYRVVRRWQEWEYGEYDMGPALFEYWLIRSKLAADRDSACAYWASLPASS